MTANRTLSFVNLHGTTKPDNEAARTIRANAMSWHQRTKYARNQKQNHLRDVQRLVLPRIEKSPQPSPTKAEPSLSTPSDLIPSGKVVSQSIGSCYRTSMYPSISSEGITRPGTHILHEEEEDQYCGVIIGLPMLHGSVPFNVLPIPLNPRVHQLLHDGGTNTIRTSVHEDHGNSFKSLIGNSCELLYVTLSYFAVRQVNKDRSASIESAMYFNEAISAINLTLAQAGSCDIPDGTVAAVACMANMENLTGDRQLALIHLNGLKQIVKLRGGLESLSVNSVLMRLVLWADLCNAARWDSTPVFPFVPFSDLPPLGSSCNSGAKLPTLIISSALTDAAIRSSNQRLLVLLQELHSLAAFLDYTAAYGIALLDQASYLDRAYRAEYMLLDLLSHSSTHPPPSPTHHRDGAVGIIAPLLHALLLYIYSNIRLTPVGGRIRGTLASHLKAVLEDADLITLHSIHPDIVVWILVVGGIGAGRCGGDRLWFAKCLHGVWQPELEERKARAWRWDEILGELKRVLWLEKTFAKCGKDFWEMMRGMDEATCPVSKTGKENMNGVVS